MAVLQPNNWIGFIPVWVSNISPLSPSLMLHIHSGFEILLGLLLIAGWQRRPVAILAMLDIIAILIMTGVNDLTFRDIGLAALSLILIF